MFMCTLMQYIIIGNNKASHQQKGYANGLNVNLLPRVTSKLSKSCSLCGCLCSEGHSTPQSNTEAASYMMSHDRILSTQHCFSQSHKAATTADM